MNKNHVETFRTSDGYSELEYKINRYCADHDYNPISISVIRIGDGMYVAFVVVEDVGHDA